MKKEICRFRVFFVNRDCISKPIHQVSMLSVREYSGSLSTFLKMCVPEQIKRSTRTAGVFSFCSWSRGCKWDAYNVATYSWTLCLIAAKKKACKISIRSFHVNWLASDTGLDLPCFKRAFGTTAVIFSWLIIISSHKETAIRTEETDLLMKHKPASYLTPSHRPLCWLCSAKRNNIHQEFSVVTCISI